MKIKTTLLAAAATLAIAPAAHAYEGLYGAIGAGLSYLDGDTDINSGATFDSSQEHDLGIGVYGTIGYAYGNGVRFELEGSYRSNNIDSIDPDGAGFSGFPTGSISGDVNTFGIMANVLYDFEDVSDFVTPFIGVGIGVVNVDHDIVGSYAPGAPVAPLTIAYGGAGWAFAGQAIAGLSFEVAEGLALDLSYRYTRTKKRFYSATSNFGASSVETGYDPHSVFAGLRWNFGESTPTPPPLQYKDCWDGSSVPVTAQCPTQIDENQAVDLDPVNFTVYFDYDKSNLTPQASTLIREASSRALENDVETVVVAGNTDTSGGSAYNQALSERRARAVRDGLIANGISADRIRLEANGENNLAKATADGVREPLNRRADVMISFE